MDESTNEQTPPEIASETMHEAHPHASKRVIIGVTAAIVVFILGGIVWSQWGERIEEVCFGEDEACDVTSDEVFLAEPLQYDTEAFTNNTE